MEITVHGKRGGGKTEMVLLIKRMLIEKGFVGNIEIESYNGESTRYLNRLDPFERDTDVNLFPDIILNEEDIT